MFEVVHDPFDHTPSFIWRSILYSVVAPEIQLADDEVATTSPPDKATLVEGVAGVTSGARYVIETGPPMPDSLPATEPLSHLAFTWNE